MNISLILAHPDTGSLNAAIAKHCLDTLNANGHSVYFHDLYSEHFNAILPAHEIPRAAELPEELRQHCAEIAFADGIIIVHPNWWGQPPAILKGWVDRVLRPGVAYEFVKGQEGTTTPVGLLKAQSALIFNTSSSGTDSDSEASQDPLEIIWKTSIFKLCGVTDCYRKIFNIAKNSDRQCHDLLAEVSKTVNRYYPAQEG